MKIFSKTIVCSLVLASILTTTHVDAMLRRGAQQLTERVAPRTRTMCSGSKSSNPQRCAFKIGGPLFALCTGYCSYYWIQHDELPPFLKKFIPRSEKKPLVKGADKAQLLREIEERTAEDRPSLEKDFPNVPFDKVHALYAEVMADELTDEVLSALFKQCTEEQQEGLANFSFSFVWRQHPDYLSMYLDNQYVRKHLCIFLVGDVMEKIPLENYHKSEVEKRVISIKLLNFIIEQKKERYGE